MDAEIRELRRQLAREETALDAACRAYDALPNVAPQANIDHYKKKIDDGVVACDELSKKITELERAPVVVVVNEPDMYSKEKPGFLRDVYLSQLKGDSSAAERIARHTAFETEKYAVSTATLGGVIPPQYLADMYAKASRNGRVFADQANKQLLPEEGLSIVIPRLTTGLAAGVQATESTAVSTQDPVEADLTVPVRTVAGYSPVSRQTLERSAYSEAILFEDLVARYFAAVDVQCISGSGASGQVLGVLGTAGVSTSTTTTTTVAAIWPKIGDVIQQINTAVGGLGYVADKIIMHPRRWGFFEAAVDGSGRPVFGINGTPNYAPNATGEAAGYGQVGRMHGLPVFTDANIPTNLGAGTNEDRIIVEASPVVHLWETADDGRPVTLSFEQQAGNALQIQLVAYGYVAFTAGRYPAASGVVSGAGFVPPVF